MTKIKKKVCTALLSVSALACVGAMAKWEKPNVTAAADSAFQMVGASVRLGDVHGIRFSATLDSAPAADSQYYVMIIPNEWYDKYDLDLTENKDYYDVLYNKGLRSESKIADKYEAAEGTAITMLVMPTTAELQESGDYEGKYLVRGSIGEVLYDNSNSQFFGVAFEQKANGERVYASGQETYSVRGICQVASRALNDPTESFTTTDQGYLKDMVKDAYNVSLGKKETDEQEELPTFSITEKSRLAVQNGTTYQGKVNNLPDIGIDVDWSMAKYNGGTYSSTIDPDTGIVTVRDENIILFGYAKVLGETLSTKFRIDPVPATTGGELEDFSDAETRYSVGNADGSNMDGAVNNKASYSDVDGGSASGVAARYIDKGTGGMAFRFALSEADLKTAVEALDYLTVRMMVSSDYNNTANKAVASSETDKKQSVRVKLVGQEFAVPRNTWVNVTVSKAQLLNYFEGDTDAEKLDKLCELGGNSGNAIPNFMQSVNYGMTCAIMLDSIYAGEPAGVLDSFDNVTSSANVPSGSFLDEYTDSKGTREYGIAYYTVYQNYANKGIRFNKTADELSKINSITVRLLVKYRDGTYDGTHTLRYAVGTNLVDKSGIPNDVWTDVTFTKRELCAKFLSNPTADFNKAMDSEEMEAAWTAFCNAFCSTGDLSTCFVQYMNYGTRNYHNIYIAGVTFE